MLTMITHSLRYCRDCSLNTCCTHSGGPPTCNKCGGTTTEAFHPTRQYLNAIRRKAERAELKQARKRLDNPDII